MASFFTNTETDKIVLIGKRPDRRECFKFRIFDTVLSSHAFENNYRHISILNTFSRIFASTYYTREQFAPFEVQI
jgi:hypothetical protein